MRSIGFALMDVQLRYLHPRCTSVKLFQGPGADASNVEFQLVDEKLYDARDIELSLDSHGFKFMHNATRFDYRSLCNPRRWAEYGQEVGEFLKTELQADYVHVFDIRKRSALPSSEIRPAANMHGDTTSQAVYERLKLMLQREPGEEVDELMSLLCKNSRIQVMNHWRSIGGAPVVDHPLVLCDASKLRTDHCFEVTLNPADKSQVSTSAFYATWHPGQKLYHWSKMTRDIVVIFKQDDNALVGSTKVLHGSVRLPDVPAGSPPRESLECRALVWHFGIGFKDRLTELLDERLKV